MAQQGITFDFNANLARFSSAIDKATNDLNKFQTNAQRMAANVKGSFQALAGVLSVGVIANWAKSGIDAADAMGDLSERTGIAIETLAGLDLAAKLSDTSLEEVAKGVNKLAEYIGDADRGNKQYMATLNALGITARDPEQALIQLADVMQKIPDQTQRASVMNDLLGKSWQELAPLLNQGGAGLRDLIDQGRQLNPITRELAEQSGAFNDQLDLLTARFEGLKVMVANQVLPVLNKLFADVEAGVKHFGSLGNALVNLGLDNPFKSAGEHIADLKVDIAELEKQIMAIDAKRVWPGYLDKKLGQLAELRAKLAYYQDQVNPPAPAGPAAKPNKDGSFRLPDLTVKAKAPKWEDIFTGEEFTKAQRKLAAAGKLTGFSYITPDQAFAKQVRESQDFINQMNAEFAADQKARTEADHAWALEEQRHYLDTYNETMQQHYERLTNLDSAAVAKLADIDETRRNKLAVIQAELAAGVKTESDARRAALAVNREALAGMEDQYQVLVKLAEAGYPGAIKAVERFSATLVDLRDQALDKTWLDGIEQGLDDYAGAFNDTFAKVRDATRKSFTLMEDALLNFVKTGKLEFKDLANSIIDDLIRIQIQESITKPLASAMSSGGLGGIFAGIGKIFGFADGGIMTSSGPLPLHTYANGGIASSPQLALFGEGRHPEAFVPLPDGRSIPVTMAGSNVQVNVINNATGTQATARERIDGRGGRVIDVMVEQIKSSIAGDISRGTGQVPAAIERAYGANRVAGAY